MGECLGDRLRHRLFARGDGEQQPHLVPDFVCLRLQLSHDAVTPVDACMDAVVVRSNAAVEQLAHALVEFACMPASQLSSWRMIRVADATDDDGLVADELCALELDGRWSLATRTGSR